MWNQKIAKLRIQDQKSKILYPAGSPNQQEINEYRRHIEKSQNQADSPPLKKALILGMTPALRLLCHSLNLQVICIDQNEEMIDIFTDWVISA